MLYHLKCLLCENQKSFSTYLKKQGITYIRCSKCGLIFHKEKIDKKYMQETYDDKNYFVNYIKDFKMYVPMFDRMLDIIEKYKKSGKILDIGCGIGLFLYLAKRRKWREFGVEISKFASKFAKHNLNLNVYNTDNLNNFSDNFFDVIVINHVLEHIENPLVILRQIEKKIKINGILLIGIPNINGIFPRIQKENWPSLQPLHHIYQFTPKTLELLLKKASFKAIKFKTENRNFKFKNKILNLILNKAVNPILEKLKLGEALNFIFIKKG